MGQAGFREEISNIEQGMSNFEGQAIRLIIDSVRRRRIFDIDYYFWIPACAGMTTSPWGRRLNKNPR